MPRLSFYECLHATTVIDCPDRSAGVRAYTEIIATEQLNLVKVGEPEIIEVPVDDADDEIPPDFRVVVLGDASLPGEDMHPDRRHLRVLQIIEEGRFDAIPQPGILHIPADDECTLEDMQFVVETFMQLPEVQAAIQAVRQRARVGRRHSDPVADFAFTALQAITVLAHAGVVVSDYIERLREG